MNKKKKLIAVGVAVVVSVLYVFNMAYFSIKPDFFEVAHKADVPQGAVFADTLVMLINQELSGLGGWIPNDIPPSPSWFLDNRPNMQLGVLEAVRYSSRVLRDNLSRQRTTDTIDDDCDGAFTSFSNDPYKWIIPSAEGKYRKGIQSIESYGERLKYGNARFYPRSDNLIQLLEQYVSLLGGVNTRLLNATRRGGSGGSGAATGSEEKERGRIIAEVPWYRIDDNFYLAQGVGYALFHLFK
ncbi:MAG: DUF2333 family protein, partial [Deltaproteobacteria bacterium]|nr:DUF2333 family protein [Deltaproteobacteria bacterium]